MTTPQTSPLGWQLARLAQLIVLAASMASCASGVLVGSEPTDPAPQIVKLGATDAQGREFLTWDRPTAFGPVPPALRAIGDLSCMLASQETRAIGYHPRAKGVDGAVLAGGGYFCQPAPSRWTGPAPQVVKTGDQLGWDSPGSFGPIPEALQERARRECRDFSPDAQPLGYHRAPLDQTGRPIANGGFLCITR